MSELRTEAAGARPVRTLVALGDSTTLGIGDKLPGGGWRGFPPLLADALGGAALTNLSTSGARVTDVHGDQYPAALRLRPDAVALVVGMNDTLRSDFDPARIRGQLDAVIGGLTGAGAFVVTARYHDHGRIFRLPAPLHRALRKRIEQVNEVIDAVVARHDACCVDLDALPGAYDLATWAVDRLHPSELGHRMLARAMGDSLTGAGCAVPRPVSLRCSGGARVRAWQHLAWLLFKGVPWLFRRGFDLLPHGVVVVWREALAMRRERRARRRLKLVGPARSEAVRSEFPPSESLPSESLPLGSAPEVGEERSG